MLCLIAINYVDRASLSVAMPLIANEFNLDPAVQGLILSSFVWTYAFMQVPGGMLADKFKPRIVIAGATIGWGFFQAIAAASTSWVMLLLTRLGLGATKAPIYPAGGKLNAIWTTQNERARGATLLDGARRSTRRDRHRLADRSVRFMARGLPGRRRRHAPVRAPGVVVHPQYAGRASLR
jgi:ACS family D-galactonate transporter-like MFS transporter